MLKIINFIKRDWELFLNDIKTMTKTDRLSWWNWFVLKPFALFLSVFTLIIINVA